MRVWGLVAGCCCVRLLFRFCSLWCGVFLELLGLLVLLNVLTFSCVIVNIVAVASCAWRLCVCLLV